MKYIVAVAILLGGISVAAALEGAVPISIPFVSKQERTASIIFGGDMQFDRAARATARVHGQDYLFSCLDPLLSSVDVVMANLEGPITDNASISEGSIVGSAQNYTFTFPSTTATALYAHNIRLVNIGNNHILNFGSDGLFQTKAYLQQAGVRYIGDPVATSIERVLRMDVNGVPLSFVNWNEWTSRDTPQALADIAQESQQHRIVFVYTHWGAEYVAPPSYVVQLAHQFIDAGANMVIGSHPHVVQQSELYKGRYIYYSLGNFIFDQHWREDVEHGLLLNVLATPNGIRSVQELPISIDRTSRPCLMAPASGV